MKSILKEKIKKYRDKIDRLRLIDDTFFQKLAEDPDVDMVYISAFDLFKLGRVIYHVEPTLLEADEVVDNGLHEVYVNTEVIDDSDVSELMQCFLQTEVDNKKFPKLSHRVNYLKHNEEGVKYMCEISDEIREEGREEERKELLTLFLKKFSIDDIVEVGFDREYLMQIASNV